MLGPAAVDWARKERFDERVVRVYVYEEGWAHGANGRRSAAVIIVTAKDDRTKCYEHWGRLVDDTTGGAHLDPDRSAEVTCDSVERLPPSHGAIDAPQ
jgi:hypothetical protein